jgi:hypothetical protein
MQCFSFSETLKFREGYLSPHIFINEVVISGMVHGKLRLGAQKMSISTIPHNRINWVPQSPRYKEQYCRFCVERKTNRTLPSRHQIGLGFFPQLQNYTRNSSEPESLKIFLWIFF